MGRYFLDYSCLTERDIQLFLKSEYNSFSSIIRFPSFLRVDKKSDNLRFLQKSWVAVVVVVVVLSTSAAAETVFFQKMFDLFLS